LATGLGGLESEESKHRNTETNRGQTTLHNHALLADRTCQTPNTKATMAASAVILPDIPEDAFASASQSFSLMPSLTAAALALQATAPSLAKLAGLAKASMGNRSTTLHGFMRRPKPTLSEPSYPHTFL
jgi:hypothetical protein